MSRAAETRSQLDVNAITLSGSSDGQAPFDSLDSTASNGKVRTNDALTYAWSYLQANLHGTAVTTSMSGAGGNGFVYTMSLPPGGLAPGQSVPVAVTFAIDSGGTFWFTYAVEA